MSLSQAFELANDSEFRTLVAFGGPPRAGRVLELMPSGQLRIEMDDPDGGDVLAWPLDGAIYAVEDIVYCLFAANAPDSAIVLGAKGGTPTYSPLVASEVRAADANGLKLADASGALGLVVAEGGKLGLGTAAPSSELVEIDAGSAIAEPLRVVGSHSAATQGKVESTHTTGNARWVAQNDLAHSIRFGVFGSAQAGSRGGLALADAGELLSVGLERMLITVNDAAPLHLLTAATPRLTIAADGKVGAGTLSPQGRLHVADGVASVLVWSNAAVSSSALTIIADGGGDVVHRVLFLYVVENGGTSVAGSNHVAVGGTVNVVCGAGTFRFAVSAAGAFTVVRSAGTGNARIAVLALWL